MLAAAAIALISLSLEDRAHGGNGSSCREDFEQEVALLPTANAPTNAMGRVSLEVEDENGTNSLEFKLRAVNLPAATYYVTVTDLTGTNVWDLGTFDVITRSRCGCDDDDLVPVGTNAPVVCTNTINLGRAHFDLTAALDPTNISYVYVFDTNGVVDLTADFSALTNLTGIFYSKTVSVTPCAATNAQGTASLALSFKKGKTSSSFKMNVAGLPKQQNVSINANGVTKLKTSTNGKGNVTVQNLPRTNLGSLQALEGRDKKGNKLFEANF